MVTILPHVNAALNALATVLLVAGYVQIKRRQEIAHKWTMLACFGVSVVFLACYLTYHFNIPGGSKTFPTYPPDVVRYAYYGMLLTHVVLAAAVPFLAVATIWLYVSITGVIVYLMLYQLYPPPG